MRGSWVHIGRLWTNGEPFLAIDAALRDAWRGYSNDDFDQILALGLQVTSVPAGAPRRRGRGRARDSWMEVFESGTGTVAVVQASGPDYPAALAGALAYQDGDELKAASGEIAVFSSVCDGTGPYSDRLAEARP